MSYRFIVDFQHVHVHMTREFGGCYMLRFIFSKKTPKREDSSVFFSATVHTVLEHQRRLLGGFLNWGDAQIIHFDGIFPSTSSSYWGTPIYGNHMKPPSIPNPPHHPNTPNTRKKKQNTRCEARKHCELEHCIFGKAL